MPGNNELIQQLRSASSSASQALRAIGTNTPTTQYTAQAFNQLVAAIQSIDERLVALEERVNSVP